MQRALRAGWPCAWPMISSLSGYQPRGKAPDAPTRASLNDAIVSRGLPSGKCRVASPPALIGRAPNSGRFAPSGSPPAVGAGFRTPHFPGTAEHLAHGSLRLVARKAVEGRGLG